MHLSDADDGQPAAAALVLSRERASAASDDQAGPSATPDSLDGQLDQRAALV